MAGVAGYGDLAGDPGFTVQALIFGGEGGGLVFAVPDRFAVFKALQMRLRGKLALGQPGFHGTQAEAGREIESECGRHAANYGADAEGMDHPNTFSFTVSNQAHA